jgi:hypothetical protein
MQLKEQEAATTRARDDSTEAAIELQAAVDARQAMSLDLTDSQGTTDELRDQLAGLKAVQALQHNLIEKQSKDAQDRKGAMDDKLKLPSVSDSALRERAQLMTQAFALVSSSGDLPRRQAAMKIIAEVRAAEHSLQDATTRLRLLFQGVIQPSKDSAAMKGQALPQNRTSGSTRSLKNVLPPNLVSMKLDSISEEAIETQSTTSSVNANEARSNNGAIEDDGDPEETPSAENASGLVLAAVAQQLREHSNEVAQARKEARDQAENMDHDMAKQKTDAREKHQEMVEALAMSRSKAERLQGKLDVSKAVIEQYVSEAKDNKNKIKTNDNARLEAEIKLDELKEQLFPQQEEQHEQLLAAVQSSKLACGRAEDFRQEIESLKARHAREIETLERDLSIVRAVGDQSGASSSMLLDLQEQVRHLTEERNELQNTLECVEIHWRSKVEDLEMRLAMQSSSAAAASADSLSDTAAAAA